MKADPPGYLWSKYECFLMSGLWDIPHLRNLHAKLCREFHVRDSGRKDERKGENYIPLGINVGGINICSEIALNANFHFSHYKSMATAKATRVLIRLEQKTKLFIPPAYRCYMWNLVRIGFMASEEMSFENADGWRTDGRRMSAYTISSPMSLQLRWAKNLPFNLV